APPPARDVEDEPGFDAWREGVLARTAGPAARRPALFRLLAAAACLGIGLGVGVVVGRGDERRDVVPPTSADRGGARGDAAFARPPPPPPASPSGFLALAARRAGR